MITLKNICKIYHSKSNDVFALNNINLELPNKGVVFIVGKSGCGKTTLLNILGTLDKYDSGEMFINDCSLNVFKTKDYDSYRNDYVGFVFQEINLLEEYNVIDNILISLKLQNTAINVEYVKEVLEKVDLKGFEKRKIKELSGGQKQRVAIARALIKKPRLLLCDEPTGALDSENSRIVFDLLKSISNETLVVIVSHDKESAEKYGDRIITLEDGKIVSDLVKTNLNNLQNSYSTKQYKMKFSTIGNLAFNFFKKKPIRFALSFLMSLSALTLFALSSSMSNNSKNLILAKSMIDNNAGYLTLQKEMYFTWDTEAQTYNWKNSLSQYQKLNDDDITRINNDLNCEVDIVYHGINSKIMNFDNAVSANNYKNYYSSEVIDFVEMDENFCSKYNFEFTGKIPTADDEAVITQYMYEMFEQNGYKNGSELCQIHSIDDLLGKNILINNYDEVYKFKIVGVVDTKLNRNKYYQKTDYDFSVESQISKGTEFSDLMENGIHNSLFLNVGFYERNIKSDKNDNEIIFPKIGYGGSYNYFYVNKWTFKPKKIVKYHGAHEITYIGKSKSDTDGVILCLSTIFNECTCSNDLFEIALEKYINLNYITASKVIASQGGNSEILDDGGYKQILIDNDYYDPYLEQGGNKDYFISYYINYYIEENIGYNSKCNLTCHYSDTSTALEDNYNLYSEHQYQYNVVGYINDIDNPLDPNKESIFLTEKSFETTYVDLYDYYNDYCFVLIPVDNNLNSMINKVSYRDKQYQDSIYTKYGKYKSYDYLYSRYEISSEYIRALDNVYEVSNSFQDIFRYSSYVLILFSIVFVYFYYSGVIYDSRHSIGILRSMGVKNKELAKVFALGNSVISLFTFILASISSLIVCTICNNVFIEQNNSILSFVFFSWKQIGLIFVITIIAILIGALIPCINILRKKPVDIINNK